MLKQKTHLAFGVLAVLLVTAVLWTVMATRACAVEINGRTVAVVKDRATAEAVVNSLRREQENRIGNEVRPAQEADYKTLWDRHAGIVDEDQFRRLMAEQLTFETTAAGIEVDGALTVVVRDEAAAERVLDLLRETYQVGPDYVTAFQEQVSLVTVDVPTGQVRTVVDAVSVLKGESPNREVVARAYDGPAVLMQAGPLSEADSDIQDLEAAPAPLLTVVATTERTVREEIQPERQVEENWDLPYGRTRVVQQGEEGVREVDYRMVAVNGIEVEKEALSTRTITEPRPEIVERGVHRVVNSLRILVPNGPISSYFGWRWERMHQGIDVALPHVTPIRAAQTGTVVHAGWYGGYGNMVEISHGNGVTTRYGHMSSIGVSNGQKVEIGSTIGRVGSTGVSTGPHLHFEIRVNGEAVNPIP